MTERMGEASISAVERLWNSFIDNMSNPPLCLGATHKFHAAFGDDDGRLWHFTRLSVLKGMLAGRQIWLSDLTYCNDRDEIRYGLRRVGKAVKNIHEGWDAKHVRIVQQLTKQAAKRFRQERHAYAFSLSEERDTRQHWDAYGGGLQNKPDPDDPHIAVGFDAQALAWPLELSSSYPPIYLFSVATVDEHIDRLTDYWIVRALKTLRWLEQKKSDKTGTAPATKLVHDALERMLVFTCAVMKHPGWNSELECRLLVVNEKFGEKDKNALPRPGDSKECYVPLIWTSKRMPIQAVVVHPLGQAGSVECELRRISGGETIEVIPSQLRPRRRDTKKRGE